MRESACGQGWLLDYNGELLLGGVACTWLLESIHRLPRYVPGPCLTLQLSANHIHSTAARPHLSGGMDLPPLRAEAEPTSCPASSKRDGTRS
jgi:hypothetical protein